MKHSVMPGVGAHQMWTPSPISALSCADFRTGRLGGWMEWPLCQPGTSLTRMSPVQAKILKLRAGRTEDSAPSLFFTSLAGSFFPRELRGVEREGERERLYCTFIPGGENQLELLGEDDPPW